MDSMDKFFIFLFLWFFFFIFVFLVIIISEWNERILRVEHHPHHFLGQDETHQNVFSPLQIAHQPTTLSPTSANSPCQD